MLIRNLQFQTLIMVCGYTKITELYVCGAHTTQLYPGQSYERLCTLGCGRPYTHGNVEPLSLCGVHTAILLLTELSGACVDWNVIASFPDPIRKSWNETWDARDTYSWLCWTTSTSL